MLINRPVPFPIAVVEPEFIDFAEERLELGYDYGVVGGPQFKTEVVEVLDGREQRNILRYLPLGRWRLGQRTIAISEQDKIEDLKYFRDFHQHRKGAKQGFRFKDWADYRATNQLIAIGDGVQTEFQLRKAYWAGNVATYRPIQKPVIGTVDLLVDGINVAVDPEHEWTVNHETGVVSNLTPLADGAVLAANFEFDVPVWFESDEFPIKLGYYNPKTKNQLYELGSVFVVEERLPLTLPWSIESQIKITQDLNLGIVYQTTEKFQYSTTKQALASGFVHKQSKRDDRRILFNYGDRSFNQAELDTLLGYFWNAKGRAREFPIVDKGNQYLVRFNSDRLNIKFEAADSSDALFKVSGLKLQLKEQSIYQVPPHAEALSPLFVDPNNPSDPYIFATGNTGGGGDFTPRKAYNLQAYKLGDAFFTEAPARDPNRDYFEQAIFWEGGTLHWFFRGDNSNSFTDNEGRNRLFYYRLKIEDETWKLEEVDHPISEVTNPNNVKVVKTTKGTGITYTARRQPTYADPLENTRRYLFEVTTNGEVALYSADDASNQTSGDVLGVLGNKILIKNQSTSIPANYVWGTLSEMDIVLINYTSKPGEPIQEHYHDGNISYNPANNVVNRYELGNVYADDGYLLREDGNRTVRIYSGNGDGTADIVYEYAPRYSYLKPIVYLHANSGGQEYLVIRGQRQNSGVWDDSTQGETLFYRFYFREAQNLTWQFVEDITSTTGSTSSTVEIQDYFRKTNINGAFDKLGNVIVADRDRYFYFFPGSGYGINVTPVIFGTEQAPYEYEESYGLVDTPYGVLVIAGRPFNDIFKVDLPEVFIVQATPV